MTGWDHIKNARIVRLNATLMPVHPAEAAMYERYGLAPVQVEANTPQTLIPHVADCDAFFAVSVSLPREVIASLTRCRLISRLGNGTDKIDVAAASRQGIIVSNVPAFCEDEMADHVMAVLLSLSRQIPRMSQYMAAGAYRRARSEAVQTQRLSTCVLGLIGFGSSGRAVARRAGAFGMRILATRKNIDAPQYEADALGVEMVDLDSLLARSDYVSLHLPLNAETYHLLDEAALAKMKPGACLINTSRGSLVDEDALAAALREGRLAGAGLDTFEQIEIFAEETPPPSHALVELDNVILTPHISGLSVQALEDIAKTGVENMVSVLSGHLPHPNNIVNKDVVPRAPLVDYDPALFETDAD